MNLSQDEINALLNGSITGGEGESEAADLYAEVEMPTYESTDFFDSVAEEMPTDEAPPYIEEMPSDESGSTVVNEGISAGAQGFELTEDEIDTLGEVGNICMGAVATTMYTLLDRRVSITTPRVSVHTTAEVLAEYQIPFVVVEVEYIEGIEGKNLLLLKEPDAAMITDVLMGGDGTVEGPIELTELHMSAISEIMNQMIGASATALSKIIQRPVNISTPRSNLVEINSDVSDMLDYSAIVVKISFDMEIEGMLKSQLLQLTPYQLSRDMARALSEVNSKNAAAIAVTEKKPPEPEYSSPAEPEYQRQAPPEPYAPQQASGPEYYNNYSPPAPVSGQLVDVRPMQYESFDGSGSGQNVVNPRGLDMVYDIPLQVSVELGKTKKNISDILNFGHGTVVVLDKMAGDPVEILVNGKLIARGEVVVIDENYGVRITELTGD